MSSLAGTATAKKPPKQRQLFVLWVHDYRDGEELVVNPEFFPNAKLGDVFEIYKQSNREKRLYLYVGALTSIRANLQLSIKDNIAATFDFANRDEVIVNIVSKESVTVDLVEITFKDQFISRGDMWRMKLSLCNECVYVNKGISFLSMRGQVKELISGGLAVYSGIITEKTKLVFRSRSAEFIIFLQMSKEMWEFTNDGQLYFEKAVNGFLPQLFDKWQSSGVNHSLTVVLFSRTFYQPEQVLLMTGDMRKAIQRDCMGKYYHDFYVTICNNERPDLDSLIVTLKQKFIEYPRLANWVGSSTAALIPTLVTSSNHIMGENSSAEWCNFLEAINLAQNLFDRRQFIDRDLTRTNQSIVVVSPGTGVYHVDTALAQDTKQRLVDKGIGCDLVCLGKPPLHTAPLLVLHPSPHSAGTNGSPESSSTSMTATLASSAQSSLSTRRGADVVGTTPTSNSLSSLPSLHVASTNEELLPSQTNEEHPIVYKSAHWMYLFYFDSYNGQRPIGLSGVFPTGYPDALPRRVFTPSCRLPELQYRTVVKKSDIIVPYRIKWRSPALQANQHQSQLSQIGTGTDGSISDYSKIYTGDVASHLSSLQLVQDLNALRDQHDASIFHAVPSVIKQRQGHTSNKLPTIDVVAAPSPSTTTRSSRLGERTPTSAAMNSTTSTTASMKRGSLKITDAGPTNTTTPSSRHRNISNASSPIDSVMTSLPRLRSTGTASGGVASNKSAQLLPSKLTSNRTSSLDPFADEYRNDGYEVNRRRWSHIFPQHSIRCEYAEHDPHWKSLTQPASLPLTTDYFPTAAELLQQYEEYPHHLAIIPEDNIYKDDVDALAKELVSQRILQGYQLIDVETLSSSSVSSTANPLNSPRSTSKRDTMTTPKSSSPTDSAEALSGSASNQMKPPTLPTRSEVKDTTAKRTAKNTATLASLSGTKAKGTLQRAGSQSTKQNAPPKNYQRKYLLSAGHSFHKINLEGEPGDDTNQSIEVKRYHKKKSLMIHAKPYTYTYFLWGNLPASLSSQLHSPGASSSNASPNSSLSSSSASVYASELFSNLTLKQTVISYQPMSNYKWAYVDQLISGYMCEFSDSSIQFWRISLMLVPTTKTSRANAVNGFEKFKDYLKQRIASRVSEEEFKSINVEIIKKAPDTNAPKEKLDPTHSKSNASGVKQPIAGSTAKDAKSTAGQVAHTTVTMGSPPDSPLKRHQMPKKRTVRLEMDTTKTDRHEWVNLKYDTVFDPDVVYEMELQWLVGTGSVINDFLNGCVRRAKALGLTLVTIPVDHSVHSLPFHVPHRKQCHMLSSSQQARQEVLMGLVDKLDFVPRKNPDQFIHRSGALLVDALHDCFEWTLNNTDWSLQSAPQTAELVRKFLEYCAEVDSAHAVPPSHTTEDTKRTEVSPASLPTSVDSSSSTNIPQEPQTQPQRQSSTRNTNECLYWVALKSDTMHRSVSNE